MNLSARRRILAFWAVLAPAMLCVGFAWADCVASRPQQSTFGGRTVTEGFGANDSGVHAGHNHNGLDIRTRDNPIVRPLFGGTVSTRVSSSYGNVATVTNGNIRAIYAHAGSLSVPNGSQVTTGTVLGDWSGTSGRSTGPHIHLEYEVRNSAGQWVKVDPIEAQRLIDNGANPQDPGFAEAAINATTSRCNMSADQLARGGNGGGGSTERFVQLCDPSIQAAVSAQVDASVARLQEIVNTQYTPPAPLSQIANNPCSSKELNRITRQFSYAPSRYINQAKNNVLSAAGPVGGILQNLFKSEIASINQAAANLPKMLNFQSMASEALGSLMSSLGIGGDAFSSEMCGLMVDMVLKYVQCENPIKLPNLGNFTGSLNDLLPNGCAGAALRSGLYQLGNSQALKSLNQPVTVDGDLSMPTSVAPAR